MNTAQSNAAGDRRERRFTLKLLTQIGIIFGICWISTCIERVLPFTLPARIIGMLLTGVLLGPYALALLDGSILAVSADLRQMALIVILIKAGLSLDLRDLKAVGRPALLLSFLPALFEIGAVTLFAPRLLGVTRLEAALIGAVLGAVSPAVIVPRMLRLLEEGYGAGGDRI